jgi:hypothetical protein
MAFNVTRTLGRVALPQPEILKWPLSHARLPSVVINATGVVADVSGPYTGRRYLLAGTPLAKRGDGQYEQLTDPTTQTGAKAILWRTVEFADGTDKSDRPYAIVDGSVNGTDFDRTKIVGWATDTISAALCTDFGATKTGTGAAATGKGRNNFE